MLGLCCYNGWGVKVNNDKAFECFERAAIAGDEMAQYYLARCYLNAHGCKKDCKKAIYWLEKAGSSQNPAVEFGIFEAYEDLAGSECDPYLSHYWLDRAIEHGEYDGIFEMAKEYSQDEFAKAFTVYTKLAEKGYEPAAEEIAKCKKYFRGL